jgi:hypothetical protein
LASDAAAKLLTGDEARRIAAGAAGGGSQPISPPQKLQRN